LWGSSRSWNFSLLGSVLILCSHFVVLWELRSGVTERPPPSWHLALVRFSYSSAPHSLVDAGDILDAYRMTSPAPRGHGHSDRRGPGVCPCCPENLRWAVDVPREWRSSVEDLFDSVPVPVFGALSSHHGSLAVLGEPCYTSFPTRERCTTVDGDMGHDGSWLRPPLNTLWCRRAG